MNKYSDGFQTYRYKNQISPVEPPFPFSPQKLLCLPMLYYMLPTLHWQKMDLILVLHHKSITNYLKLKKMDPYQNQNPYMGFSDMTPEEMNYLQQATSELSDAEKQYFYMVYSSKRKSQQDMLIFCLVGLFLVPGLQRFMVGQIGMGILYLFTIGFCFIGSIIDLINHKSLANEFNQKMAYESFQITKMAIK